MFDLIVTKVKDINNPDILIIRPDEILIIKELIKAYTKYKFNKIFAWIIFNKKFIRIKKIGEKNKIEKKIIIIKSINETNLFLLNKYSKLSVWISK